MIRVHRTTDGVHDGRKVRRRIFRSKSLDQPFSWSKKFKMSWRNCGIVRSSTPPRLLFIHSWHLPARPTKSTFTVHDNVAENGRSMSHAGTRMPVCILNSLECSVPQKLRMSVKTVQQSHGPRAACVQVQHNVRGRPNSNISDLDDDDSVIPGGCSGGWDTSGADRLAVADGGVADCPDDVFPVPPLLGSRRFNDCRAICAIRRRSIFSSGGNRRHNASPTVGSTSW